MDVKALHLNRLREHPHIGQWEVLSKHDIAKHFAYSPKPVFRNDGQIYVAKTWRLKLMVFEDELYGNWRAAKAPEAVRELDQVQAFYDHAHPGHRLFVHSVLLNHVGITGPDGRLFFKGYWRGCRVKI